MSAEYEAAMEVRGAIQDLADRLTPAPRRWEYKLLRLTEKTLNADVRELSYFGAEGWRVKLELAGSGGPWLILLEKEVTL